MYGYSSTDTALSRPHDHQVARDVVRVLCAVLFPPLGVFLRVRFTVHFWLSVCLTLFGYVPGLIHALWVLVSDSERLFGPRGG